MLFEGFTPPALFPPDSADPINRARVEQSASASGPFSTIEGPTLLSPAISDPEDPPTYSFSTDDDPGSGWFRVVWVTVGGVEYPTVPQWIPVLSPYAPSVGQVAQRVRLMLRELGGDLAVNFTDETTPTAQQVQGMIADDFPLVLIRTGDLAALQCGTADDVRQAIRTVAAERVALQVLEIFLMDEVAGGQLGIDTRREALNDDLSAVVSAAAECRAGEVTPEDSDNPDADEGGGSGVAIAPQWSFPRVPYLNW